MTSREIIKRLEEDGWYHVKTTGDHYQMKHPTKPGKVTIVHPAKDFSIGTLRSIENKSGGEIEVAEGGENLPPATISTRTGENICIIRPHLHRTLTERDAMM